MNLTNDDVQDILRLLDSLPYDELRLETARFALTLRRTPGGNWTQQAQVLSAPRMVESAPSAASSPPCAAGPVAPDQSSPPSRAGPGLSEVRAPLLGTFYRAPRPGAPPFVEVGSRVEEDTVVGIIETMKLMNPVYGGVRGAVVEICLADAQFAEQDAVLMRVQPET